MAATGSTGERPSFEDFYIAEYPRLVRILLAAGAMFSEAEEAAQEAMLQAFRSWDRLTNPSAWSRTTALRAYYRALKRERREIELTNKAVRMTSVDTHSAFSSDEQDDIKRVRWIIRGLPQAQREVLALSYDGFMPMEIAKLLNKDPGTVRSNLREARKKLIRELAVESPEPVEPVDGDEDGKGED